MDKMLGVQEDELKWDPAVAPLHNSEPPLPVKNIPGADSADTTDDFKLFGVNKSSWEMEEAYRSLLTKNSAETKAEAAGFPPTLEMSKDAVPILAATQQLAAQDPGWTGGSGGEGSLRPAATASVASSPEQLAVQQSILSGKMKYVMLPGVGMVLVPSDVAGGGTGTGVSAGVSPTPSGPTIPTAAAGPPAAVYPTATPYANTPSHINSRVPQQQPSFYGAPYGNPIQQPMQHGPRHTDGRFGPNNVPPPPYGSGGYHPGGGGGYAGRGPGPSPYNYRGMGSGNPAADYMFMMAQAEEAAYNNFAPSHGYGKFGQQYNNGMTGSTGRVGVSALSAADAPDGQVYQVYFKLSHRNFILSPTAPRNIAVGDFVKVEADRGEDLGIVVDITSSESFVEIRHTAGHRGFPSCEQKEIKRLLRMSTLEERAQLPLKLQEEDEILQDCIEKVNHVYMLPIVVSDVEFQFDRHKLTFYFQSNGRVDFRVLVRDLFALHKTRIWMAQLEPSYVPNPTARSAFAAGGLMSRQQHMREVAGLGGGAAIGGVAAPSVAGTIPNVPPIAASLTAPVVGNVLPLNSYGITQEPVSPLTSRVIGGQASPPSPGNAGIFAPSVSVSPPSFVGGANVAAPPPALLPGNADFFDLSLSGAAVSAPSSSPSDIPVTSQPKFNSSLVVPFSVSNSLGNNLSGSLLEASEVDDLPNIEGLIFGDDK